MKKFLIFLLFFCMISFSSAWSDDFNRSNSDNLGANWTKIYDAGTAGTNASINSNRLLIQDTSGANNIRVLANNIELNDSLNEINFTIKVDTPSEFTCRTFFFSIIINWCQHIRHGL